MPLRLEFWLYRGLLVWIGVAVGTPVSAMQVPAEAAPLQATCPKSLPDATRCWVGTDSAGAHYAIAIPPNWNESLVLHAHGGPFLGSPSAQRVSEDLERWRVVLAAGFAWAGSSYRQGGVAVRAAAEDTERLRLIFNQWVKKPQRTILHGQSWGASVAAVAAEMFSDGKPAHRPYDAVLLSSGVLGGGSRSYDFRLDLRVVYQYLCHNHPLPDEPQYPLWMGLPHDAKLTATQLAERTQVCLGLGRKPTDRTPAQAQNLKTLLQVIRIPERSVLSHLSWATFHFRDIYLHRSGGGNVFDNTEVQYIGSDDDVALNAGVARYPADPRARAMFAQDTDPGGRIPVPVLTVHGVDDPTAFVELEDSFRQTMRDAGTADHLVQTFTQDSEHSYLSDAAYASLLSALLTWVEEGKKPTPQGIAESCRRAPRELSAGCRFLPGYWPAPLASRVPPRNAVPIPTPKPKP